MSKMLSGLIATGTWLAVTSAHISRNEIGWVEHLSAIVPSVMLGSLGLSFVLFVLFFTEGRDVETQGELIVRAVGVRIVLFLVGLLLITASSYLLYLVG
jgi:hypothetical protein